MFLGVIIFVSFDTFVQFILMLIYCNKVDYSHAWETIRPFGSEYIVGGYLFCLAF